MELRLKPGFCGLILQKPVTSWSALDNSITDLGHGLRVAAGVPPCRPYNFIATGLFITFSHQQYWGQGEVQPLLCRQSYDILCSWFEETQSWVSIWTHMLVFFFFFLNPNLIPCFIRAFFLSSFFRVPILDKSRAGMKTTSKQKASFFWEWDIAVLRCIWISWKERSRWWKHAEILCATLCFLLSPVMQTGSKKWSCDRVMGNNLLFRSFIFRKIGKDFAIYWLLGTITSLLQLVKQAEVRHVSFWLLFSNISSAFIFEHCYCC